MRASLTCIAPFLVGALFIGGVSSALAQPPKKQDAQDAQEAQGAQELAAPAKPPASSREMAARIDQLLAQRWEAEGVEPAPPTTDPAFLRRVHLDLTGVIPTVSVARRFLQDTSADKRERLIERLLRSPRHASHLAVVWRTRMLNEQLEPQQLQTAVGLEQWLQQQFATNLRYDNLVADLVASTGSRDVGPAVYFASLELKPEKLAASTARIFMGLQIQCAECHNHPFDHWTQEDFWGYAAFFAQLQGQNADGPQVVQPSIALIDRDRGEVTLPGMDDPVSPMFPGGDVANQQLGGTRRQQLAIWLASRDNPYLARAAVNWTWAHLFGRGLVDPVDDLGEHNPPSHPQLMQELCDYFERQSFDLRDLLKTLCSTRAYQLSSQRKSPREEPVAEDLFAQMAVKALTAEQHYDSLNLCLSQTEPTAQPTPFGPGIPIDQRRLQFVIQMQTPARSALEYESGPRQALQLMNGPLATEATSVAESALLGALEAPFFSNAQRLETLYLATLSRYPTEAEKDRLAPLMARAKTDEQLQQLLSDVLWAVLNSAEYGLND